MSLTSLDRVRSPLSGVAVSSQLGPPPFFRRIIMSGRDLEKRNRELLELLGRLREADRLRQQREEQIDLWVMLLAALLILCLVLTDAYAVRHGQTPVIFGR
jgi:hypothetical protein